MEFIYTNWTSSLELFSISNNINIKGTIPKINNVTGAIFLADNCDIYGTIPNRLKFSNNLK